MSHSSVENVDHEYRDRVTSVTKAVLEHMSRGKLVRRPTFFRNPAFRTFLFVAAILFVFAVAYRYHSFLHHLYGMQPGSQGLSAIPPSFPNAAMVATALFAVIASFLAFLQWQEARNESSYEMFYERLRLITEQYEEDGGAARQMVAHFWQDSAKEVKFRECLYVYLEMDNLEYMCGRYELGYIRVDLFERALRTFVSRCVSPSFCEYASWLVRRAGHNDSTANLIEYIVASFSRENDGERIGQEQSNSSILASEI